MTDNPAADPAAHGTAIAAGPSAPSSRSTSTSRPSVLVVGEALIDLLEAPAASTPMAGAEPFVAYPSGGPTNTAVALARLGVPVALAARVGRDPFGRILRRYLASNGVGLSHVVDAAEHTTVAVVGVVDNGNADYSFYTHGTADWQWTDDELPASLGSDVAVVHTGSLALALPPGGAAIENFLVRIRDRHVVSLDPNVRTALIDDMSAYRTSLERWVALSDIVKVSADDLAAVYPGRAPADVAGSWARPQRLVALTWGSDGATVLFGGETINVPGFAVDLVDTIAAGDTFTAGLLHGLLRAGLRTSLADVSLDDVRHAARRGCAAAAAACARPGPNPPSADEVERLLGLR